MIPEIQTLARSWVQPNVSTLKGREPIKGRERRGSVGSRHGSSFVSAIFYEGDGRKNLLFS